jgi:hypothetical protein
VNAEKELGASNVFTAGKKDASIRESENRRREKR